MDIKTDGFIYLVAGTNTLKLKAVTPAMLSAVQDDAVSRQLNLIQALPLRADQASTEVRAKALASIVNNPPRVLDLVMNDPRAQAKLLRLAMERAGVLKTEDEVSNLIADTNQIDLMTALLAASGIKVEPVESDPTKTRGSDGPLTRHETSHPIG
jgi:hypothetical protein